MRVLHVIPSLAVAHGGPTHALGLMERQLVAHDVCVETATTDDDGLHRRSDKPCGVPVLENGVTRRYFRKRLEFYKASPSLAWWLVRHAGSYDLMHIHALFSFSSMAAVWAARWAGVPYVLRPLGTLTRYGVKQRRPWLKKLSLAFLEGPALRHAAAVHFTSVDEQREAKQCGVPMRSVVIPLGVESPAATKRHALSVSLPQLNGAPYLLFLSRLDPKKNVEGLLRAFGLLGPSFSDVTLLVAGDGAPDYVASLRALAVELGVAGRVVWAGHVGGDLKAEAFAGAELFVLPSFSENFGIAAAEALMAGLPCVLGQGVAIARDVVEAGAGVVVPPDPASIAAGLKQVIADAPGRAIMAERAAALARDKYSAQAMGANLVRLYSGILGK